MELLSCKLCIPFICCKCAVLKIWINHKIRTFYQLFHSCHKMYLLALLGLFTDQNDRFPNPSIYFVFVPFHRPDNGTPVGHGLPVQAFIRSTLAPSPTDHGFTGPSCIGHYRECLGSLPYRPWVYWAFPYRPL